MAPQPQQQQQEQPAFSYNEVSEIHGSRIFDVASQAHNVPDEKNAAGHHDDNAVKPDATTTNNNSNIVAMPCVGALGRFGNQLLQYMFLRAYAAETGREHRVSQWVGSYLFTGAQCDQSPTRRYRPVRESHECKANSIFTEELLASLRSLNQGKDLPEIDPASMLLHLPAKGEEAAFNAQRKNVNMNNNNGNDDADKKRALACKDGNTLAQQDSVELWGWFQLHTRSYVQHRDMLRRLFTPVPAVTEALAPAVHKLHYGGADGKTKQTVVGIHIRRGDYENIALSSFGYVVPIAWYRAWLASIWDTLENPVLFIATDDPNGMAHHFPEYNPQTMDSLGAGMPAELKSLKAGFFPDFYLLTQCDIVAISNSSFSFAACMLNTRGDDFTVPDAAKHVLPSRFVRPHYDDEMVPFNPWSAAPILHRPEPEHHLLRIAASLAHVRKLHGWRALARNVLLEMPLHALRTATLKATFAVKGALQAMEQKN